MLRKYLNKIKQSFLDEFSSVRLAVTLFVFLAITTLIGTVLPEEPLVGKAELIKKYGMQKYHVLKSFGLTDVFHSWWYLALLTMLGINLTVASFRRVFPKSRIAFAWPVSLKIEAVKKMPVNCILKINNVSLEFIQGKLKEKKYRTKVINSGILAVKGGWHRLGASVTHIGILTLFLGAALSVFTGFNGMAQLSEGEGFYVVNLKDESSQIRSAEPQNWLVPISKMPVWLGMTHPYLIKVNKTWRINYDTGEPKQWYSDLSVFDENKNELIRKIIHVNNPLEFKGLDIYQSSWGKFLELTFNGEHITLPLENFRGEELVFLPLDENVGLKLKVEKKDKSDFLEIYSENFEKPVREKFLGKIDINTRLQIGPLNIGYFGIETFTGLQFKSNPGNLLVYPGLFFIVCGVFIAFGSRKQIWILIDPESKELVIGGMADRAKSRFVSEFEELISNIVTGFGVVTLENIHEGKKELFV